MKTKLTLWIRLLLLASLLTSLFFEVGAPLQAANAGTPQKPMAQTPGFSLFMPFVQSAFNTPAPSGPGEWSTVAANPQRTSWTPTEVYGQLNVEWYRPIEAYISQNVQLIASGGLIYVATAKGLYALNANNGAVAWRFDTEMPLGNSPTVVDDILYVGGYDRKLHALDARTGAHLWEYTGAGAGYESNPLVVDGRVIIGNRDGYLYAIGAHGTSNQGQLLWRFKAGGTIHQSAAYQDGIVYFAANDNHAYAVRADNGSQVWKSQKLLGDGYHSFWPVIYQDKVIFSAAVSYRMGIDPGTLSVKNDTGTGFDTVRAVESYDLFYGDAIGTLLGESAPAQPWAHGKPTISAARVLEYLENGPDTNSHTRLPWRRTFHVLNTGDGREYTFDSDHDGYPEYLPIAYWGTNSGNRYPPIIAPDNVLYVNNRYNYTTDSQGRVMGWVLDSPYLSLVGGQGAIAEPQAISGGGNLIYRNLCCDRVGDYFDTRANGVVANSLWSYNLSAEAPGYDPAWTILPGWPRLQGWYKGDSDSVNGIYHNHGDQNPLIPYNGRIYAHRSNTIVAYGPGQGPGSLPMLQINPADDEFPTLTTQDLTARLESEVQKMIAAGHLRPGYYNNGQFSLWKEFADYFSNPGDTIYTLAIAYPHLSATTQAQLRTYLQQEFQSYFDPVMYAYTGWADGAAREAMPLPPEIQDALPSFPKREADQRFSWRYPQHNFYAMWKYAQIFGAEAGRVYDLAKSKLEVPVSSFATTDYFRDRPFELNAYIAGYFGFLELQELAGRTTVDATLRTQVTNELNRLLALRVSIFAKDTPYVTTYYHKRQLNIARNFMMLVPELGDYLNQHALSQMQAALNEYEYIAPYWFVSRYQAAVNEGATSALYNSPAIFQARAFILKQDREQLAKYIDAPAFERGDLFYIQNLAIALQTQPALAEATPEVDAVAIASPQPPIASIASCIP